MEVILVGCICSVGFAVVAIVSAILFRTANRERDAIIRRMLDAEGEARASARAVRAVSDRVRTLEQKDNETLMTIVRTLERGHEQRLEEPSKGEK